MRGAHTGTPSRIRLFIPRRLIAYSRYILNSLVVLFFSEACAAEVMNWCGVNPIRHFHHGLAPGAGQQAAAAVPRID